VGGCKEPSADSGDDVGVRPEARSEKRG
jgi:hypothetical protein